MRKDKKDNNKHEAEFCTKFGKWWEYVGAKQFFPYNLVVEAKNGDGSESLNFKSKFKKHQLPTMIQYKQKPMHWKISDMDTISTKHYDISCTQPEYTKSYIAIFWTRPRNKTFYLIDPATIQGLCDDGYKSIDEKMAMVICEVRGELK